MEKENASSLILSIQDEVFKGDYPKETFDGIQNEETIDLLDNMGYLDVDDPDGNDRIPEEAEIEQSRKKFREEFLHSIVAEEFEDLISEYETSIQDNDLSFLNGEFDEEELEVLAKLTDIEGEFHLSKYSISQIHEDSILSRVLNFRLSILSLSDEEYQIKPILEDQANQALEDLGLYLGLEEERDQINATDDFNKLIEVAISIDQRQDGFRNMAFFEFDSDIRRKEFKTKTKIFEKFLQGNLPNQDVEFYDDFRVRRRRMTDSLHNHVSQVVKSDTNAFILRLVQLKLWLIGSYEGDLDSNMGDVSTQSFLDLYRLAHKLEEMDNDEEDDEQEYLNPRRFLLDLGEDNLWALNYKYFFQKGLEPFDNEFSDKETISEYLEDLLDKAEDPKEKEQIENAVSDVFSQNKNKPVVEKISRKERRKRRRKLRKGKGLFKNVGQFFKRAAKWIGSAIEKVVNAIKSFFKLIKNGVVRLFREIKEAVGRIFRGIKFLFSKRIVKTPKRNPKITSDFDFDFDVKNDLPSNVNTDLINQHLENLQQSKEDFRAGLKFMEVAIPLIIQLGTGPVGWVKAGIQLVKMIARKKAEKALPFI